MSKISKWNSRQIKHYKSVNKIQKQIHKDRWNYLSIHPEIRAILRVLIHQTINADPQNINKFVSSIFNCCSSQTLVPMINEQLKYVNKELKKSRWSDFDARMLFSNKSESTHSLLSQASTHDNVNPILTYALVYDKNENCDF